jgi:hypothetical protein
MSNILANASEVSYPCPEFVFGLIGFAVFVLLGLITWSFRDVANRRVDKGSQHNKGNH